MAWEAGVGLAPDDPASRPAPLAWGSRQLHRHRHYLLLVFGIGHWMIGDGEMSALDSVRRLALQGVDAA